MSKRIAFVVVLIGCASARPASVPSTAAQESQTAVEQACSGIPSEQRNVCRDTDEILRVERMPVELRGGEVLTGARMVFRAAPGRTAQSLKHAIDCQVANGGDGGTLESYTQFAYCPLAIRDVTTQVQAVADGLAVEIKPRDASVSRRISHSLAHGQLAIEMQRFESVECHGIPPKARAACPLLGPVTAIRDVSSGARVEFPKLVSVDDMLGRMRCHYSFAKARGFSEVAAACPLYMRGLHLERSPDGQAIEITVSPAGMVDEMRKRVREEAIFSSDARGRE